MARLSSTIRGRSNVASHLTHDPPKLSQRREQAPCTDRSSKGMVRSYGAITGADDK